VFDKKNDTQFSVRKADMVGVLFILKLNNQMCLSVFCEHQHNLQCVISGFRGEVHEICALLGIACNDNSLPAFTNNLSLPSSKGARGCPALCNNPEERSSEHHLQGMK